MGSKGKPSDLDTYADDLAALLGELGLDDVILGGHSTDGEVVRYSYIGRHGNGHVSKLVLVSTIASLILKTDANPEGVPIEAFDELHKAVPRDRSQLFMDLSMPLYGYNCDPSKGHKVCVRHFGGKE